MPPRLYSRYTFCRASRDDRGRLALSEPEPFRYIALPDNALHIVAAGETLFTLAAKYFASMPRPAGLWWIIADFQPEPLFDPTLTLAPGTQLVIPSTTTVVTRVFAEDRRRVESQ